MSTFSAIREWATQLDYWEQAALEKIASGTVLDETDYSYLLQLCMEDYDLLTKSAARPQLTFPAKLAGDQGALPFTLERLFNLRNVGALPGAQNLTFGAKLTAIYGSNGSGKSSYTRPLGCAVFARGEREVLTDARKEGTADIPAADFELSRDGAVETVTWTYGERVPQLSRVYVYDGASVNAHLTRSVPLKLLACRTGTTHEAGRGNGWGAGPTPGLRAIPSEQSHLQRALRGTIVSLRRDPCS